jgi:ketosteroid isomerase-like protein
VTHVQRAEQRSRAPRDPRRSKRILGLVGASALGTALVSVGSSPHSAASPDDVPLTDQQRQVIVNAFATAFVHDDHPGIVASATPDIIWTIPGASVVSGQTNGIDGVIRLADVLAQYDLHIAVQGMTFGMDTVAVKLHDSGEHNGKTLDQDVVNVLTIRDGKVASVSANLSNVGAFDTYFS